MGKKRKADRAQTNEPSIEINTELPPFEPRDTIRQVIQVGGAIVEPSAEEPVST